MRRIGLVGGLGPSSTVVYYLELVEKFRKQYGDDSYPDLIIDSVNMHDVVDNVNEKNYDIVAKILLNSIQNLINGGAEIVAITSNTPHIVWDLIKDKIQVPSVSIIEATIEEIKARGHKKVVVLGTEATMSNGLYANPLTNNGIEAIIPNEEDRKIVGNLLYPNLENGIIIPEDRIEMIRIAEKYIKEFHADALLLGCTEIPLIIKQGDVSVDVLDTTAIHIKKIYQKAN